MPESYRCHRSLWNFTILFLVVVVAVHLPRVRSMATTDRFSSSDKINQKNKITTKDQIPSMPRILCLHGHCQSGTIFANKIGGARRKLAKIYQLDFLDAQYPVMMPTVQGGDNSNDNNDSTRNAGGLGWWTRRSNGSHDIEQLHAAMEYVRNYVLAQEQPYDVILGFSQGGLLATALALSGDLPAGTIRAVITASSPYVPAVFDVAKQRSDAATSSTVKDDETSHDEASRASSCWEQGSKIPKLHFAGEADTMIPPDMVKQLCQIGGNGRSILHEKGHLFPTNAIHVNAMMDFLAQHVTDVN